MTRRSVVACALSFAALLGMLLLAGPASAAKARKPAKGKGHPAEEAPAAAALTPEQLVAAAAASALHPQKAFPEYAGLPFGGDMDGLMGYVRQAVDRDVRPKMLATPDVRQRDKLQAEAAKEVETVSLSHVDFRGQPTGWDVSILSGEFRHNARQEMRRRTSGELHSYFLLSEGSLWKLVRQAPAAERSFDQLLTALRGAYGAPTKVETRREYRDGQAVEVPERATWEDGALTVQAVDMGTLYGAHLVKWALTPVEQQVAAIGRGPVGLDIKDRFRTEDVLRDVTTPSDRSVDDIVDRLLQGSGPVEPAPKAEK
jgi:hypothetical protein